MTGKVVNIQGRDFISPKGYPKFGFLYDEEKKQYAIANVETCEITKPFVDEVIYSELPLETWVANYVVVRIGELYYLADCDGNCYLEYGEPYIICRNVFVEANRAYCINESLTMVQMKNCEIVVNEYGGYKFAFWQYLPNKANEEEIDTFYLIKPNGYKFKAREEITSYSSRFYNIEFSNLHNWVLEVGEDTYFINSEFEITIHMYESKLFGKKSQTYWYKEAEADDRRGTKYSTYFHSKIDNFRQYQELEIVWYNEKTYFFLPDGNVEEINASISMPQVAGDTIIYRQNCEIVKRAVEGHVLSKDDVEPKETYFLMLFEKLLEKTSK